MLSKSDLRTSDLAIAGIVYVIVLVSFTVDKVSLNIPRGTQTNPSLSPENLCPMKYGAVV